MPCRLRAICRGAVSLALFGVFGLGAILISPLMLLLRRPERGQPLVRAAWRFVTGLFVLTRMIRVDRGNLRPVRGSIIVANHPSLIDVVLLTVLVPRTLYVAKHALLSNPFLAAIVRATALPDGADLLGRAPRYLREGWNVLVFPEGTRSPKGGGLQPLHRGAAQLALRAGAPLVGVRIDVTRRLLGKGQPPWDVGDRPVTYAFRMGGIACAQAENESLHAAAVRVTAALERFLQPVPSFAAGAKSFSP